MPAIRADSIYFLASRDRSRKIEELYDKLQAASTSARAGIQPEEAVEDVGRQLSIMSPEPFTVADKGPAGPQQKVDDLLESIASEVKFSGADAVYRLKFKHVAP